MRKIIVIILLVCMVIFALGCWCFGLYETLYVGVIIYIVMTFFLMVVLALSFFRKRRENDELKQLFLFIISSSFLAVSAGREWRDFLYHSLDICDYKSILFSCHKQIYHQYYFNFMKKVSLFIASVLLVIVGVSCALWGLRSLLLLMGGAIILGFFSVIVLGMAIVINIFVENGKEEDDSKIR